MTFCPNPALRLSALPPARSPAPMQKIETVDMPRSEALASGQTTLQVQLSVHVDHIAVICFDLLHSASPLLESRYQK